MKTHILFVLDYFLPHRGWVETVFEKIINWLQQKWYKITVLTSRFDKKLKEYEINNANIEFYRVWFGRLSFLFCVLIKWIQILSKNNNISVIHGSTYWWAIPASLLWFVFHKKVVLTVHEVFWSLWLKYKWFCIWLIYLLFEKIIFWLKYDVYHCVSRYTMNSLRLLYWIKDEHLNMIYNGVDTDFWSSKKVSEKEIDGFRENNKRWKVWWNKFVVLYYGHAGVSKWIDYLVDSVPFVLKQDRDILFVFNLIDSNRKDLFLDRINDLKKRGYDRNIQIFKWLEKQELRTMLASSDLVVAPSLSEGFGSVHTEVVAMWKPLITTFVASIPEVVSGKVAFVRPGSVSDITTSILNIKKNQQIYSDLPTKTFDWNNTISQIEKLY